MRQLADFCETLESNLTVDESVFKAKFAYKKDNAEANVGVRILKVEGQDKYCVECTRKGGDHLLFLDAFKAIEEYFSDVIDAAY